jgi:hypothetical protein
VFTRAYPLLDQVLPKFLDEISAARFLQAARNHTDLFTRLCGVTLILTGMRQGEFLNLTTDCIVQIGENYWLRVPLGKMHNDRYIPLHPEVKQLHWLLDHEGYLPDFAVITDGKTADVTTANNFTLPAGSIVAVDRGYYDFDLFAQWNNSGIFFVTRLKSNNTYEVVKDCPLPQHSNILTDQLVRFTSYQSRQKFPGLLRRVVVWDEDNQREIELLTNHLRFGATTIGRIYRDRWEIELFFKVQKQHLKIKTFVGTSPNALRTQIWTALIAVLLLKYLQFRSKYNLPLCRLVALLRLNLFSYRNLWDWLDDPFETPPELPNPQLELAI